MTEDASGKGAVTHLKRTGFHSDLVRSVEMKFENFIWYQMKVSSQRLRKGKRLVLLKTIELAIFYLKYHFRWPQLLLVPDSCFTYLP